MRVDIYAKKLKNLKATQNENRTFYAESLKQNAESVELGLQPLWRVG